MGGHGKVLDMDKQIHLSNLNRYERMSLAKVLLAALHKVQKGLNPQEKQSVKKLMGQGVR